MRVRPFHCTRHLNTPEALAIIDDAFDTVISSKLSTLHQHALVSFLETIDELLGLNLLKTTPDVTDDEKRIIIERVRAREQKNYDKSDELRSDLEKSGITVRDTASGPIWEYTTF
jgi:cysteinyl-tRNA synthetase